MYVYEAVFYVVLLHGLFGGIMVIQAGITSLLKMDVYEAVFYVVHLHGIFCGIIVIQAGIESQLREPKPHSRFLMSFVLAVALHCVSPADNPDFGR